MTFIENNNNVAWRNFNVVPGPPSAGPPPGTYRLAFLIPGAFDTGHVFELESIACLPKGSRALLEIPDWLADSLRPHVNEFAVDAKACKARIPLHPSGIQRLGSVMLHAKSAANCALLVQIPEAERKQHDYEIAVRQIYRKVEVGRVTWRLGGPKKR